MAQVSWQCACVILAATFAYGCAAAFVRSRACNFNDELADEASVVYDTGGGI
jgi:hypothetical protein